MSEERIVRYRAGEVPKGNTDWDRVDAMAEEEIEANANADPDNPLWTDEMLANAVMVYPRPKDSISIRLDADILEYLRRDGPGYQTRINAILRSYMEAHSRR